MEQLLKFLKTCDKDFLQTLDTKEKFKDAFMHELRFLGVSKYLQETAENNIDILYTEKENIIGEK